MRKPKEGRLELVYSIPHDKDEEPELTDAIDNTIALLLKEVQVAKDADNFEKAIEIIEKIIEMTEKSGLCNSQT